MSGDESAPPQAPGAHWVLGLARDQSVDSEITFSCHPKVPELLPHCPPGLLLQTSWAAPEDTQPLQWLPHLPLHPHNCTRSGG